MSAVRGTPATLRRLSGAAAAGILIAAALLLSPPAVAGGRTVAVPAAPAAEAPALPGPIGHQGRWLTDAEGRTLLLNGVNLVAKEPGVTPAAMGFGDDDAAWLAANGFDVVRLGTTASSIMPSPGVIDAAYLGSFAETVHQLTAHGLLVLVDLHQDGWGPSLGSDGFPGWMTLTHGAEDTHTDFPLYYITNPAIQAAFQSFWNDEAGPGGVALQDRVGAMFDALASRFNGDPGVIGYDLINEPWPGTTWQPCIEPPGGCPGQDQALDGYQARMAAAIRAQDPDHLLFGEPYVLFNFGQAPTNVTLPGDDTNSGLSYHLYTTDPAFEPAVQEYALDWSQRTGGAVFNTEFGATGDVAAIDRQIAELDGSLVPWIWWAYNEHVSADLERPAGDDNIDTAVVGALVRPHPRAVAGTPTADAYDTQGRVLRFSYSTTRPGGGSHPGATPTVLQVAPRSYPGGYSAKVTGGTVTSAPGAAQLTVENDPGATDVFVKVWPADQPEPPDQLSTTAPPTTTPPTTTPPAVAPSGPGPVPVPAQPPPPGSSPAAAVAYRPGYTG